MAIEGKYDQQQVVDLPASLSIQSLDQSPICMGSISIVKLNISLTFW